MWIAGRTIDYHERIPWAILWVSKSPTDEVFVYREWNPAPTKGKWTNETIAHRIADLSGKEKFVINLIDPLANRIQTNTGQTIIGDLNEEFFRLRKRGFGTGGYWEPYDTKGLLGRDNIRLRLRNSIRVQRPFNNVVYENDTAILLPTLWVFRSCPETAKSLKQWRYEEWGGGQNFKDKKEQPSQKFSHFCTALEGLLKDNRFKARQKSTLPRHRRPQYFKNRG